jgi:hypothetical protein
MTMTAFVTAMPFVAMFSLLLFASSEMMPMASFLAWGS